MEMEERIDSKPETPSMTQLSAKDDFTLFEMDLGILESVAQEPNLNGEQAKTLTSYPCYTNHHIQCKAVLCTKL